MEPKEQAERLVHERIAADYSAMYYAGERRETHLTGLIEDYKDSVWRKRFPVRKLTSWMGYICAKLIEFGLTTIEDQKIYLETNFRHVDYGVWDV